MRHFRALCIVRLFSLYQLELSCIKSISILTESTAQLVVVPTETTGQSDGVGDLTIEDMSDAVIPEGLEETEATDAVEPIDNNAQQVCLSTCVYPCISYNKTVGFQDYMPSIMCVRCICGKIAFAFAE